MRKYISAAAVSLLLVATPVFAQSSDVQAQIKALQDQIAQLLTVIAQLRGEKPALPSQCVDLKYNFGPDDTDADNGGEISKLQSFLVSQGLLNGALPKGYFGLATMKALQQWQAQHNVVSSGDPDTTGYGFIGPKTRKVLACGVVPPPNGGVSVTITSPNSEGYYYYNQPLIVSWKQDGSVPKGSRACVTLRNEQTQNYFAFPGGGGSCVDVSGAEPVRSVTGTLIRTAGYDLAPGSYRAVVQLVGPTSADGKEGVLLAEDQSDSYFKILESQPQGGITVTAPNGGEQWELATINSITWKPYSYNPDVNPSRVMNAFLETKNADGSFTTLGSVIPSGKASIHWMTGFRNDNSMHEGLVEPGSNYYIRVVNTQTGASDRSDGPFTILPTSISLKVNGSTGPVNVQNGQTVTLSWSVSPRLTNCYVSGTFNGGNPTNVSNNGSMPVRIDTQGVGPTTFAYIGCSQAPVIATDDPNPLDTTINGKRVVSKTVSLIVQGVPQPNASVRIISPNGGEALDLNRTVTVKWTHTGLTSYSVALYKNDQWFAWINKDLAGVNVGDQYSIDFTPSSLGATPAGGYKIYITGQKADGTGYVDDKSDAPFSLFSESSSPSISMTSATRPVITFNYTNLPGGLEGVFLTSALTGTNVTTASIQSGSGSGSIVMPEVSPAGTYYLKVLTTMNNTLVARSANFEIGGTPKIDLTAPLNNATFSEQQQFSFDWVAYNAPAKSQIEIEVQRVPDDNPNGSALEVWRWQSPELSVGNSSGSHVSTVWDSGVPGYPTSVRPFPPGTYRVYAFMSSCNPQGCSVPRLSSGNISQQYAAITTAPPKFTITAAPTGPAAVSTWTPSSFAYTGTQYCSGAKYVGYSQKYGVWVGAQLCDGLNTKYKLYMSTTQNGTYNQIADYGGHGQDHCELINPTFTIPNDDSITSGTCSTCSVDGVVDVQNEPVFARSKFGESFKQTTSTYWADLTTGYYMCGVSIGDTPTQPATKLSASPASGTAPLTTWFTYTANACDPNSSFTMDYGNGVKVSMNSIAPFPYITTNCYGFPTTWPYTYPGTGTFTAKVIAADGSTKGSTVVTVASAKPAPPTCTISGTYNSGYGLSDSYPPVSGNVTLAWSSPTATAAKLSIPATGQSYSLAGNGTQTFVVNTSGIAYFNLSVTDALGQIGTCTKTIYMGSSSATISSNTAESNVAAAGSIDLNSLQATLDMLKAAIAALAKLQ